MGNCQAHTDIRKIRVTCLTDHLKTSLTYFSCFLFFLLWSLTSAKSFTWILLFRMSESTLQWSTLFNFWLQVQHVCHNQRIKARNQPSWTKQTSLRTALKRPLLVFLAAGGLGAFFWNPPNLISFLLLIVSALSLGASPSMTKTSFTPISVRDDTRKNKCLKKKWPHSNWYFVFSLFNEMWLMYRLLGLCLM